MFGLKNLFAIVGLAVVAFVAAGWYLGWYKIAQQNNEIHIDANPAKVKSDLQKGVVAVENVIEQNKGAYTPGQPVAPPVQTGPSSLPSLPSLPPMPQPPPGIELPPMPTLPQSSNSTPPGPSLPLPPMPLPVESWKSNGG
ncbi:MAG TPA: hypothetical protein VE988_24430 [Gemmataceae bacterium]|nr:hypothetical protein [Gemmataceae bacterium]